MMSRRRPRTPRAFTLLELMLVVLIIGLLMGVSTWAIVAQGERARLQTTQLTLRSVKNFLAQYQVDYGTYPATLRALVPTYTEKMPTDAWKKEIKYFVPGTGGNPYSLYSEGKPNANAKIDVWEIDKPEAPK